MQNERSVISVNVSRSDTAHSFGFGLGFTGKFCSKAVVPTAKASLPTCLRPSSKAARCWVVESFPISLLVHCWTW
jgi:hypothetical protein